MEPALKPETVPSEGLCYHCHSASATFEHKNIDAKGKVTGML